MNGSSVLTVAVMAIKYSMELRRISNSSRFEIVGGQDGFLLRDILDSLGRQYEVVVPDDHEYGVFREGNWTGMIGMVHRGEADLAYGGLIITEQRRKAVHFSTPVIIKPLSFAIGRPVQGLLKNAYLYPFQVVVWHCLFGLFMLLSFVLYLLFKRKHSFLRIILEMFGNVLRQPLTFNPNTLILKVIILLWLLCALVLSSSYSGALLAYLTLPTQSKTVENFSELSDAVAKGTHKAYALRGSSTPHYLNETRQDHLEFLAKSIDDNGWFFDLKDISDLTKVVNQNVAFISGIYLIQMAFSKLEQQLKVFISKDTIAESVVGLAIKRDFCCPKQLDKIITRIAGAGLLQHYFSDGCFKLGLYNENQSEDVSFNQEQLSFEAISGAFLLLIFGLVISFITFLVEMFLYKYSAH